MTDQELLELGRRHFEAQDEELLDGLESVLEDYAIELLILQGAV